MKMTLLEMTQEISSKLNGDEINSIGDTVESTQIAHEIRATYYDLLALVEWPFQYNLVSLQSSGDLDRPTHMTVPEAVDNFKFIQYRNTSLEQPVYQVVEWCKPEDFIAYTGQYPDDQSIEVQDYSGAFLRVGINAQPRFYTMFDDEHVVFDSYDQDEDDTLQESKVIAMGQTIPSFDFEDNAYPDLPVKYFPMLLAEASAACHFYQKQVASPVDERRARRGYVRHFNNRNRSQDADNEVLNFGR